MQTVECNHALGDFIRAHRERLPPQQPARTRRRTPGWRREELSEAAGVSVTWLTWLEQGRPVAPSASALARLADALTLNPPERASLFELAGRLDPHAPADDAALPDDLLALPSRFAGPAYVLDYLWTARAWNADASQLFTGWLDEASVERNLLRFVFLNPAAHALIADWDERARRLVAEFRADYSRRLEDSAMQALVNGLTGQSERFAALWAEQAVLYREGGARIFRHPLLGERGYVQTTLLVAAHGGCKLVCLAPA